MPNFQVGNGGHAPGHIRDAILAAIEALYNWRPEAPEPTVELEVNYTPRPITLCKACGLVWNCTDILPSFDFDILQDALSKYGVSMKSRTYAAAGRAMHAAMAAAG
jgi:hypothetical protein